MAFDPFLTQVVAQGLLDAFEADADAGTAAVIRGLTTAIPADADAAETGTELFVLTASAILFTTKTDGAPGADGTFDTVTDDTSAVGGTLAYFRILTQQSAGTVVFQGLAGTSASDLIMNTLAITGGSTVSLTSGVITVPESAAG